MRPLLYLWLALFPFVAQSWVTDFEKELNQLDQSFNGQIGLVIKNLQDDSKLEYNAGQRWYLSSTLKVIIAISLMDKVETGKIRLEQKLTLKTEHFVDGAGPLLWSEPGEQFSVSYLLETMLKESDNTAADMLIGLIGIEQLNRDIQQWMPGSGEATSLLEVRYLAYSELHPKARSLSNMDFVQLKNHPVTERHIAFAKKINLPVEKLKSNNLEEAMEKYYARGYNSASLQNIVGLLEKLDRGQLLSPKNTKLILGYMENMNTGEHRIKAGLEPKYRFLQKTGTQIHRACNVGLIRKGQAEASGLALAVCIQKDSESENSDWVFKQIGKRIVQFSLL
jgi:beta-lactamase class A